jgi:predicted metal-binding membrane protein
MMNTSAVFGGVILLAAGLYQFTPFKNTCLRYCQRPLLFLSRYWQPDIWGALRMGLRHGGYCLGCCWFLMALLFVGGIMNLVWIAGIVIRMLRHWSPPSATCSWELSSHHDKGELGQSC